MNRSTGTKCAGQEDIAYIEALLAELQKQPQAYDTSRLYIHGCSMGAAFSSFSAACVHESRWGAALKAWSVTGTGLKVHGDGVHLPGGVGECDNGCEYWPFVPGSTVANPPLKSCVFDNRDDIIPIAKGIFNTSERLVSAWAGLGNPTYSGFYSSGGHCGIHSYDEVLKCLMG